MLDTKEPYSVIKRDSKSHSLGLGGLMNTCSLKLMILKWKTLSSFTVWVDSRPTQIRARRTLLGSDRLNIGVR